MTRAVTLAEIADGAVLTVDSSNSRIGIGSTQPTAKLDVTGDGNVSGTLTATSFSGDGTGLTGVASTDNIITGTAATFTGGIVAAQSDVSVRNLTGVAATFTGVLTYEDVTNIDSVGIITARSHVSIADSILHTGDTDTAIRFPAADTFTVETGGSERVRVDSTGRVKIGDDANYSASSGAKLSVELMSTAGTILDVADQTDGFSTLESVKNAGGGGTDYGGYILRGRRDADDDAKEYLRIDSSGNVGINSTIPRSKLHVANGNSNFNTGNPTGLGAGAVASLESNTDVALQFLTSTSTDNFIYFGDTDSATTGSIQYDHNINALSFNVNGGTERLRIHADGEVEIKGGNAADGQTPLSVEGSYASSGNVDIQTWARDGGAVKAAMRYVDADTLLKFGTTTNHGFGFITNTAERFRVDSSGRMLIGATSAVSGADANGLLQVSQDVASNTCIVVAENTASSGNLSCFRARLRNSAPDSIFSAFLQCDDSGASKAVIRSNGGLANFSANNVNLSDRNAKKDITAAASTWNSIKNWEIVNFRYKEQPDDADLNLGVIAQQIEEISPEMVTIFQQEQEATETEPALEQRLGVREQQMQWAVIKALQEAMARIETLETQNAALEARLTALEGS